MTYVRRNDDLSRLPLAPETIAQLRALGVNTIGEMFDDPHGIEDAEEWNVCLIEAGTDYSLLEWGTELPARAGALYWALEESMLTVYGNGTMMDYTDENQPPWVGFRDEIGYVTIYGGVENVGARAFENCTGLTFLELSSDAKRIGTGAFRNCSGLEQIFSDRTLVHFREEPFCAPDEFVTFVGHKAFEGTPLPKEKFGDFYIAHNILMEYFGDGGHVVIPKEVVEIAPMAFENAPVCSVKLPATLKRIGVCAFQGTQLQELTLPRKLEQVDAWAFHNIKSLTSVTLMNRRVDIAPTAFARTPVAAQSQPGEAGWASRYHLQLVDDPEMAPCKRVVVAENPAVCFGTQALNVRKAARDFLSRGQYTLIQFFPNWIEEGTTPFISHRSAWWWAPKSMYDISDHLPQSVQDRVFCWDFLVPEEDSPMSTAGLCRKRRKGMPIWYAIPGIDTRAGIIGIAFLEQYYSTEHGQDE